MRVLACDRNDCTNAMCDLYLPKVGYLCWECQRDFKNYIKSEGKYEFTENELVRELNKFMLTAKRDDIKIDVDDYFNRYSE